MKEAKFITDNAIPRIKGWKRAAIDHLTKKLSNPIRGQQGTSLAETLVGIGILGAIGVTFLTSLTTGINTVGMVDEQTTAQSMAQAQLEDTKSSVYLIAPTAYPTTTITPPGDYSVSVEALPLPDTDDDIQKIKVTVSRNGKTVLVLEDYKVNR